MIVLEKKQFYPILILFLTICLIVPNFNFAKERRLMSPPENPQEAKETIIGGIKKIVQEMPSAIKKIFKEEAIPIWQRMWNWIKNLWQNQVKPFFNNLWYSNLKPKVRSVIEKIRNLFNSIIKKKEKEIRNEFTKEKIEMKKDVSRIMESLWQKLKDLLTSQ